MSETTLAELGPAFALATGPAPIPAPRVTLAALADPRVARRQVAAAAGRLGTVEARVAASWVVGGGAAPPRAPLRALPPPPRRRRRLPSDELWWRDHDHPAGAGWWIAAPATRPAPGIEELRAAVVDPLAGLIEGLQGATGASRRMLWGEVATATAKVGRVLRSRRPAAAAGARALLSRVPLRDATLTPDGHARRSTCCLAYRVPGGRPCADCPLGAGRPGPSGRRRGR